MSDQINDKDAVKFTSGQIPMSFLPKFRKCATKSKFKDDQKKEHMSSSLLYPFYGGKHVPPVVVSGFYHVFKTKIPQNAAQIGTGQSVVCIINCTSSAIDVTRPYRDGGFMIGYPYDAQGTANRIPGKTTIAGEETFGVGAYANGIASIIYGSGAVLKLSATDSTFSPLGIAYGSSINSGAGLGVTADLNTKSDIKAWFGQTGDKTNFTAGGNCTDKTSDVKITASVAPWESMQWKTGPLFTVLIEPV